MATTRSVQFAYSKNTNAPQLTHVQGTMIAMLDAVLVNGYGSQTIQTLASSSSGVITATFGTAHNYKAGQILLIEGASDSSFNGRFRVDTVSGNNLTFKEKLSGAKTTAGTITAKVAPLGYQIAFTDGANKRAYKSLNPENALYYIFDDNLWSGWGAGYAKICNVGLALEMTEINTISGMQCPFNPANPNQNWQVDGTESGARPGWAKLVYGCWSQGQSTYLTSGSSGNHIWSVVGNDEGFYLIQACVSDNGNPNQVGAVNYFGKYESLNENPFNYLICANHKRNTAGEYQEVESAVFSPNKTQAIYYADCKMFASKDGATSSIGVSPIFPNNGALNTFYSESKPNFTDSTGVGLIKVPFIAQQGAPIEGYLPHVYVPLLSRPFVINSMAQYAFLVEKHENGNHFIEINGLCSYAQGVATLFFELKD